MTNQISRLVEKKIDTTCISQDKYINLLYSYFHREFIEQQLPWKCDGLKLSMRRIPEIQGKHAVFWHIITCGDTDEASRTLDHNRCTRIHWIPIYIREFNNTFPNTSQICWWIDTKRTSHPRYLITRTEFDYIVIVEERPTYALLITAYYIESQRRRDKFYKDYQSYWKRALHN